MRPPHATYRASFCALPERRRRDAVPAWAASRRMSPLVVAEALLESWAILW